jgi:hypothetical protein
VSANTTAMDTRRVIVVRLLAFARMVSFASCCEAQPGADPDLRPRRWPDHGWSQPTPVKLVSEQPTPQPPTPQRVAHSEPLSERVAYGAMGAAKGVMMGFKAAASIAHGEPNATLALSIVFGWAGLTTGLDEASARRKTCGVVRRDAEPLLEWSSERAYFLVSGLSEDQGL